MTVGPRLIVLVGPTAGGKSELAAALGLRLPGGGAILGADSMQVYRHMDAGTAKPEAALRRAVPHHLIDIVEPAQRFTVADWLARADALIAELLVRGVWPIVVGGTNLYIKALLEGMFDAPEAGMDPAFRAGLAQVSGRELHARLARVDPAAAGRIHPNDHKRLVRALEVQHLTGRPISSMQSQWELAQGPASPHNATAEPGAAAPSQTGPPAAYRHNPILIGLDWPTEAINRRINARVRVMFGLGAAADTDPANAQPGHAGAGAAESLPEEVRRLEAAGLLGPPESQCRQALGYKQVLAALRGQMSMDEAFEQTKILTRRFAKTQRTWLKRYRGVHWIPAGEASPEALAAAALDAITSETRA